MVTSIDAIIVDDPCSFCCPECKGKLERGVEHLFCHSCGHKYSMQGDIPCFSDVDNYYGEVPKDVMSAILKDAEHIGYKEAFAKHITNPFVAKYVGDEKRALWIGIIPHDGKSVFLDVGCGWGTNTLPISRVVGHVYALDATYERVKLVQIRSRQHGMANISPVLGSAMKLPLPDNSLDIVAFNGVLEWLGGIDKTVAPIELQSQALREAYRVLKPGGYVYVGIENRYSLRYMLGDADDHSFMRFTSLMPRRMANLYCRLRTGQPYYTHTYSLDSYHRLLSQAKFASIRSYFPWPNYRNPVSIIPLTREALLPHFLSIAKNGPLPLRQKVYLWLLRSLTACEGKGRFCHSFCFVAQK